MPPDENGWLHVDLDALAEKRGSWAVLLLIATMIFGGFDLVVLLASHTWGRKVKVSVSLE
jgi:hypothetical protein